MCFVIDLTTEEAVVLGLQKYLYSLDNVTTTNSVTKVLPWII